MSEQPIWQIICSNSKKNNTHLLLESNYKLVPWLKKFEKVYSSSFICASSLEFMYIVAKFNLNQRRSFKPYLNFIFDMKIKSMFTFQIDIRNQIDLHFYFNIIFHLMSRFIDQV